jgi:hypothetical protein
MLWNICELRVFFELSLGLLLHLGDIRAYCRFYKSKRHVHCANFAVGSGLDRVAVRLLCFWVSFVSSRQNWSTNTLKRHTCDWRETISNH